MSYKVAPLTVNPRQKLNVSSRVFVSQPSAEEELLAGRLFVLLEIEVERPEDIRLADFIIADAYRQYYESEIFLMRERMGIIKPETVFEAAVAKLNRNLAEIIEQEKIRISSSDLHATVGLIHGNKLFFSQLGQGKAILLYRPKNKNGEMLADYSLVDITEKTNDPTQEIPQANTFFTNIVAGALPAHGYFFFANEALFEYLTKKQLTDIITTLPPSGAAEQVKNMLEQTNAFVPFFGLIIKNTTGEKDAFAAPAATFGLPGTMPVGMGRSSVNQLNQTQEKTEQLLSPSGMVNIKKWLSKLSPVSKNIKSFANDKARQLNIAGERLSLKKKIVTLGQGAAAFLSALFMLIWKGVIQLAHLVSSPQARKNALSEIKQTSFQTAQKGISAINRFNGLDKKRKTLLVVIGICIVAFLGSVVYTSISSRRAEAKKQITALTEQFTQKENQLEATLLYNNREGAKQLLDEMSGLITQFPTRSEEDKTRQAEYKTRYENKLDSIYNIYRLAAGAPLLDLADETQFLLSNDGSVYAVSIPAQSVRKISADGGLSEPASSDKFPIESIVAASVDTPNQYIIGKNSVLSYLNEGNVFTNLTIDNPSDPLEAAAIYNNRLYSAGNGMINRFNLDKNNNSFTSRMDWYKDSSPLGKISSLAIDGRIYLIENNTVTKLSGGQREALTLDPVSPSLESPTKISVSPDLNFLYIIEAKHNRMLVYNKTGTYIAQYAGDNLNDLRDAVVDQRNRLVYFLNGKSIYKTEAKHFEE